MKKRIFSKAFSVTVLAYAGLVLLGLGVWLWWLNGFLTDYENSRPEHAAQAFFNALTTDYLEEAAAPTLQRLNFEVTDREACKQLIAQELQSAEYKKITPGDTEEELCYAVLVGKRQIGTFTLTACDTNRHGFICRVPGELKLDFMYLANEAEYTIPSGWTLRLGGYTAGPEAAAGEVRYKMLGSLYGNDEGLELPAMTRYVIGPYFGEPEAVLLDDSGEVRTERTEEEFADNCTPKEKESLQAVTEPFIARYVDFSGNDTRNALTNYYRLAEYLDKDSKLYTMLRTAIGSLGYASSRSDVLNGTAYNGFMKLSGEYYVVDVSYSVTTRGNRETITVENGLYLVYRMTEKGLRVTAMYSH